MTLVIRLILHLDRIDPRVIHWIGWGRLNENLANKKTMCSYLFIYCIVIFKQKMFICRLYEVILIWKSLLQFVVTFNYFCTFLMKICQKLSVPLVITVSDISATFVMITNICCSPYVGQQTSPHLHMFAQHSLFTTTLFDD